MEDFALPRTGRRVLKFTGERLAGSSGRWTNGRENNRYHDLEVYRTTDGGRYVVSIQFSTCWKGETDVHTAVVVDDPGAIEKALRAYDPCPPGIGYPPGETYSEKQAALAVDLRRRYEAQVGDLFDLLGAGFAEEVA